MGCLRHHMRKVAGVATALSVVVLGAAFSPSAHADDGVAAPPTVAVDPAPVAPPAPAPTPTPPARPLPAVSVNPPPSESPGAPAPAPDAAPGTGDSGDTSSNTAGDNSLDINEANPQEDSSTAPQTWLWNWSWNCDP